MLRHRGDTRGQAARKSDQHILDGRGAVVLGGKDLRVIGIEGKAAPVRLFLTQP